MPTDTDLGEDRGFMNISPSIALDILSVIYMVILFINLKYKHKRELVNYQYCQTVIMICVFLILDIAYMSLYGNTDLFCRTLLKIIKSFYFIVNSVIVWLWVRYIDCILFGEQFKAKKHRIFYNTVLFVNTAMVIVNFFTGFLFEISQNGTFVAGRIAMWLFTIFNYLSIILATIILIKNRKKVEKNNFFLLLIFPLPPLFAEMIQIFIRTYSLICTYAVSALIVFQVSQNNAIYTDELTGLANRRMLNESLQKWFSDPKGFIICGIMIDLDGLKYINDTYGHLSGDNALLTMADIIKEVKHKDIISARYGGDEFVLIWRSHDSLDTVKVEETLTASKRHINNARPDREKIEFSMGHFCCRDEEPFTAADFLKKIDDEMYQCKNEKKQVLLQRKDETIQL